MNDRSSAVPQEIDWNVNFPAVMAGAAAIVALTRFTKLLSSYDLYFTFSAFLFNHPEPVGWSALAIKLVIPFLSGILASLLVRRNYLRTAGAGALLGAIVQAWPAVVLWNVVAPPEIWPL